MRWSLDAGAEILRRRYYSCPEERLPNPVHDDSRGGGAAVIHQPLRETEAVALGVFREWMQELRHVGLDGLERLEPITTFKNMRHARLGALRERERGGGVSPISPGTVEFRVQLGEGGIRKTKHVEQFTRLFLCALFRRNGQQLALRSIERINAERAGLRRRAQTEAAKGVAVELGFLVGFAAMAIAAAVLLINAEFQSRAVGKSLNRLGAFKARPLLVIATDWDERRGPASFLRVAVDSVGDAEAGRFLAGQRAAELNLVSNRRVVGGVSLAGKFLEEEAPSTYESRPAVRQVRVEQRLQPEAGDVRERGVHPDMRNRTRFHIAPAEQRAVALLFVFGREVEPLAQIQNLPIALCMGDVLLPSVHPLVQVCRVAHRLLFE